MYSGSTEFNNLIERPGGNALKTRFTFSDFSIENFTKLEYYGGSNNSTDIAIGTTNMAYLEVGTMTDRIITNREFLFEVGMELSDGTIEYAPMGYFTVQKPDSDEGEVNFTAYDRMQKFEKPYKSNLEYPTDSQKILYELCTMCKVELATPILNPITITDKLEGYTCREVLGYIAGIHGLFACFDRYGKLNVRWYISPIEKQIGLIWSLTKSQSDYTVEKVTLAKDSETTYTSGSGGSRGINHSNPYATFDIAKSLYTRLGGYTYRPCEISMLDDIRLDAWDTLKVTYLDGSVLTIPVMSLEHSFTSGETRVKSFGKTDTESEYRYSGPTTQAMDRMATELLVVNRVVATKVDAEYVNAHAITTDNLSAIEAEIKSAVIEQVSADYADIHFANIDTANINKEKVKDLFVETGLIKDAIIVNGKITGYLDAVEINAASITAGTIVADRIALVMRDEQGNEKGLIYALNNLGELESKNVDTIDGNVITPHTIGADHIIANSITANEIATHSITANELSTELILSQKVVAEDLEITGGSVNVETSAETEDVITLRSVRARENISDTNTVDRIVSMSRVSSGEISFSGSFNNNDGTIYNGNFISMRIDESSGSVMKNYGIDSDGACTGLLIGNDKIVYDYAGLPTISVDENGNQYISSVASSQKYATSAIFFSRGYVGTAGVLYSSADVIANFGETNQVSLSSLAPVTQTITIPSSNANFSGTLYVATSGKVRTIYAELATKKQITSAMGWLNVHKFAEKPIQTVESTFPINGGATPVPVFLARALTSGSLDIIARQNIASGASLRFTFTVILA